MSNTVVGDSNITFGLLKDLFRQFDDGSITAAQLKAFLNHQDPFHVDQPRVDLLIKKAFSAERITEIEAAFSDSGDESEFLDSIDTAEELELVKTYCIWKGIQTKTGDGEDFFTWWRKDLEKWGEITGHFPADFETKFPLIAAKIKTDVERRILLRMAEFSNADLEFFCGVVEPILHAHEVEGKEKVESGYTEGEGGHPRNEPWHIFTILAYYTQIAPHRFKKVFLSGANGGTGSHIKTYIEWPEENTELIFMTFEKPGGILRYYVGISEDAIRRWDKKINGEAAPGTIEEIRSEIWIRDFNVRLIDDGVQSVAEGRQNAFCLMPPVK